MMKQLLLLAVLFITGHAAIAQTDAADAVPAQAPYTTGQPSGYHDEGILSFHANLIILPSGLLKVEEKIKVYARGGEIRRGIFRTIPMHRNDRFGRNVRMKFKVHGVTKNGDEEPYSEIEEDGELNIRIGDADVTLNEGIYEYVLTYETSGQVGFFEGYDELYWNVTGSNWSFNIEEASAAVVLPSGANTLQTACYTGPQGSRETNCRMTSDSAGIPVFRTTQRLTSGEGFTIAVGFTAGVITRPPPPGALEQFWNRLQPYKAHIFAIIGSLIMFLYGFFTWRKHGKDPEQPVPVPTFEAPDGLTPGGIRYLYKHKTDDTGFTATIVNMAIKKALTIKNDDSDYVLEKNPDANPTLAPEEEKIFKKLFSGRNKIKVDDAQHRIFSDAKSFFRNSISEQHNLKQYYLGNTRQIVIGGLVTAAIFLSYLLILGLGQFLFLLFALPFIGVGGTLLIAGLKSLKDGCGGIFLTVFGSVFTLVPLGFVIVSMSDVPPVAIGFVLVLIVGYFWYIYLIKAPTPKGAAQQARIEGFVMYLKTAEEHRLNMLTTPERTPALFEKLLPYAIALDLENEWGNKFENVLTQAAYTPDWYAGDTVNYRSFPSTFSRGLISSVGQAQVDPTASSSSGSGSSGSSSWSSGSSGGGSSGGGGGGGGGGGW